MSEIKIVFGTETGNSESLAKQTAKRLQAQGYQVSVVDLENYAAVNLSSEQIVLIITSTYGEGEPPSNAEEFYEELMDWQGGSLAHLKFSVCALGDSDYDLFCQCGKDFDEQLARLGAQRIAPRVDCDVDYVEFEDWWGGVDHGLKSTKSVQGSGSTPRSMPVQNQSPKHITSPGPNVPRASVPRTSVPSSSVSRASVSSSNNPSPSVPSPRHNPNYGHQNNAVSAEHSKNTQVSPPPQVANDSTVKTELSHFGQGQRSKDSLEPLGSKKRPYFAKITENYNLNHSESQKETRHLTIELRGEASACELEYEVGDALGVYPRNDSELINEIIHYGRLNRDERVLYENEYLNLFYLLKYRLDIVKIDSRLLKLIQTQNLPAHLQTTLQDRKLKKKFMDEHHIIDLFRQGFLQPTAEQLVKSLRTLSPRLYSISSSPKAHPNMVQLTVDVLKYELHNSMRNGVASNFLAESEVGSHVSVYVHPTKDFKLCSPEKPIIMIGPGTGIAPFKAMLEEREVTQAPGQSWLFFGAQRSQYDFLYREQLNAWVRSGVLSQLDCAWSRDQAQKVYVQDLMYQHRLGIWRWLEAGAYIYVCGDAKRMAKDVNQTLIRIIAEHGHMSEDQAEDYIEVLRKQKRYLRDVY